MKKTVLALSLLALLGTSPIMSQTHQPRHRHQPRTEQVANDNDKGNDNKEADNDNNDGKSTADENVRSATQRLPRPTVLMRQTVRTTPILTLTTVRSTSNITTTPLPGSQPCSPLALEASCWPCLSSSLCSPSSSRRSSSCS